MKNSDKGTDITKHELFDILDADADDSEEEHIDAIELINKYGTYNIQPTANTKNVFPLISQGLSETWKPDEPRNKRGKSKGKKQ